MGMKTYLVSYRYEGAEWNIDLPANSHEDAERRLKQLYFANIEGELIAKVPGPFGSFAALWVYLRNLLSGRTR